MCDKITGAEIKILEHAEAGTYATLRPELNWYIAKDDGVACFYLLPSEYLDAHYERIEPSANQKLIDGIIRAVVEVQPARAGSATPGHTPDCEWQKCRPEMWGEKP